MLAAVFGLVLVPERLRTPAILAGAALIALAAVWQAGEAKGAHDAFARDAERALEAESKRAALSAAEATRDRIRHD